MNIKTARRLVVRALAEGSFPTGMWTGPRRARVRCSPRQRECLVEAALELGLRGPLGAHFDPVDFWARRHLHAYNEGGDLIFVLIVIEGDHQGEPVIEHEGEPRIVTALTEEMRA